MIQWTKQLSKSNFERFIVCFCETMARSLEGLVLSKKYYNIGAFLIDTVTGIIFYNFRK